MAAAPGKRSMKFRPSTSPRTNSVVEARWPDRPGHEGESLPMIHNYILSIDGDEATGTCSNELRIVENGKSMIASGVYQDRLRRENGRWRFAKREITFFHWAPIQEGWAKPVEAK